MTATVTPESTISSEVPQSPVQVYVARRRQGVTHERALGDAARSYGRRPKDLEARLERARRDFEGPEREVPEPTAEVPEPSPFDALEGEVNAKLAALAEARQRLSLDALTDEDARLELANVEDENRAAEAELERLALARTESSRRDREAEEKVERELRQAAAARAAKVEAMLPKLAKKIDSTGAAFARALADYQSAFYSHQAERAAAAGAPGRSGARLLASPFECALKHHLATADATALIDLPPGMPRPLT
jgi:DNA repair exonuclease SbcCD ATPase subunit